MPADIPVWVLGWRGLHRGRVRDASSASLGIALSGRSPRRGARVALLLPTSRSLGWPALLLARVVRRGELCGVAFTSIPRASRSWLRALLDASDPGSPAAPSSAGERPRIGERRSDRRHYDERLTALSGHAPHLLVARDLSLEGLRVDRLPWAEPGAELRISFPVPGHGAPIALAARVARHDGTRGTLLRFEAMEPDQRDALRRLLELLPPLADGRREGVALAEVA